LSRILQIFLWNDHHIEMTCRAQHFGRSLEGQSHSMTLQQNRVWPITLLFKVRFYNCFTEMITILGWHVASNIRVDTLKVKVTAWPCSKIVSGPWLHYLIFFTEMLIKRLFEEPVADYCIARNTIKCLLIMFLFNELNIDSHSVGVNTS